MHSLFLADLAALLSRRLRNVGLLPDTADRWAQAAAIVVGAVLLVLLAALANWIAKRLLLRLVQRVAERSRTVWDDALVKQGVFTRLSHLAPAAVFYAGASWVSLGHLEATSLIRTAAVLYMMAVGWWAMDALLNAVVEIYHTVSLSKRIPIRSFVQVVKLVLGLTLLILVLATVLHKNPSKLLAGMGAMTAVLLLVFRDAILGFVAGIQLSVNRMIHVGDWIDMPKHGADGDVIDISLTTVKVQNWDKTITTIPTYALVSDSFKNWRGMSESGGRRIKRTLHIDMTSIRFCDAAMLERFRRFQLLRDFLDSRQAEIDAWNQEHAVDTDVPVNGRRLTNVGLFRAYLVAYLRHHPKVHKYMTFLVRHLEPTAQGLPIQIYVFSNDPVWANFEALQADLFDHILAVVPEFGLRVYQQPSGADLRCLASLAE